MNARIIDKDKLIVECPHCGYNQKAFFFGDKSVHRLVMQTCGNSVGLGLKEKTGCGNMFTFVPADFYKDDQDWEGFAREVMEGWPEGGIDGFDLQDIAIKYGLLRPRTEAEKKECEESEETNCEGCYNDGGDCYVRTFKTESQSPSEQRLP